MKEKIHKFDYNKFKTSVYIKRYYQQGKKAAQRMGEIFTNHLLDKDLVSRIYIKKTFKMKTKQLKYGQRT